MTRPSCAQPHMQGKHKPSSHVHMSTAQAPGAFMHFTTHHDPRTALHNRRVTVEVLIGKLECLGQNLLTGHGQARTLAPSSTSASHAVDAPVAGPVTWFGCRDHGTASRPDDPPPAGLAASALQTAVESACPRTPLAEVLCTTGHSCIAASGMWCQRGAAGRRG